jgi:hypothetical protein
LSPLPVVIYAARSTPDENESTASQVERVRDRLKQEGERSVRGDPFTEDNVSAYKGSRQPALRLRVLDLTTQGASDPLSFGLPASASLALREFRFSARRAGRTK